MSNKIYELREKLMRELETFSDEKPLSPEKLDHIDKLSHAIKCIDTVCAMEERGYSRDDSYNSYRRNRSYNSYADRYPIGSSRMYYDVNYGDGHSTHDEHRELIQRLDDMLKMATNEKEREAIRACMNKINS